MRLHNLRWWQPFIDNHPLFGKIYGLFNLLRRYSIFYLNVIKLTLNNFFSNKAGVTDHKYSINDVVVSLTSYEKRVSEVYLTIESIMTGKLLPNRIVLWLPIQMKNTNLPSTLKHQQRRGLDIEYCDDIRSFKKLIPSLAKFKDSVIVTIDDDQIYDRKMLEYLVEHYEKDPSNIYANTVYRMTFDEEGNLRNYCDWINGYSGNDASLYNFPIGEGGILYPPMSINEEVFNENAFMTLCPFGDDIWFYAMAKLNGYNVVKTKSDDPRGIVSMENPKVQKFALKNQNVGKINSLNDRQIKSVFEKYNIYSLFIK